MWPSFLLSTQWKHYFLIDFVISLTCDHVLNNYGEIFVPHKIIIVLYLIFTSSVYEQQNKMIACYKSK
jgi:branched-subunit amino acid permease